MRPGPVFLLELVTTARRARYYAARTILGLILLAVLWQNYNSYWSWRPGTVRSIREMAEFARGLFAALATTQLVAVVVLTPVLLAGAIADEKQRKTLHYLLASRLTSGEIVLDKLAARLLHVGVFLAIGLPILSLLTLLGGIPPEAVALTYLGTTSTAFFLAGVSILISTYARKAREAMVAAILFVVLWLFAPWLVASVLEETWPALRSRVQDVSHIFAVTNPFYVLSEQIGIAAPGWSSLRAPAAMVAAHLGAGAFCLVIATWRLRPVFRAQSGQSRAGRAGRGRVLSPWTWRRPACGEDPMLWKERYTARRGSGLTRWLLRSGVALGLLVLGYWTLRLGLEAWDELWTQGLAPTERFLGGRQSFNVLIRVASVLILVIWGIGLAVTAASSISSEREEDTWISLLTTDLTPAEIIRAKMLGAFWSLRILPATLVVLWLLGMLLGALFPLGAVFGLVECAVFAWFTIALGVRLSLTARTMPRAAAGTVGLLVLLNGGYLILGFPLIALHSAIVLSGCSPFVLGVSLLSYSDVGEAFRALGGPNAHHAADSMIDIVVTCILGTILYAVAAAMLTSDMMNRFDEYVDRPRHAPYASRRPAGPHPAR